MRLLPALLLSTLLVASCGDDTPEPEPVLSPSNAQVEVFKGLSHAHLKKGQYPQAYAQSPPVGGPHSLVWLQCQVYDVAVPEEAAVHSEEHGGVWLTYQPGLPAAQVAALAALAQVNREFVLVSPYAGQDSPVVASTWGLQLKVATPDDPKLVDFVRTYAGGEQGGEKGVGCARTGQTLSQVQEFLAAQK